MTLDENQTPRRRGRPRLMPNRIDNRRSAYLAALDKRNSYLNTRGWWPTRSIDFPESLTETLARVANKESATEADVADKVAA
jgi:hypothetical protein